MTDNDAVGRSWSPLVEPVRPRYFTGMLLSAGDLTAEQSYQLEKDRRHNWGAIGSGVVCGLAVAAGAGGTVTVGPGIAIDGWGREIVVPVPITIDPVTMGAVTVDPVTMGAVTIDPGTTDLVTVDAVTVDGSGSRSIWIEYDEAGREPISTLDGVVDGSVAETFRIVVREGELPAPPPGSACAVPDSPGVLLATARPGTGDDTEVDQAVRAIAGVRGLLDLIAELSQRIDDLGVRLDQLGGGSTD